MSKMVLHATPVAQWQALVSEAASRTGQALSEELESYLTFLLVRFTGESRLANTVMAVDFLNAITEINRRERAESLRDVGDKCLLFAGLFPQMAQKKRVRVDYYVRLGRSAYATLSVHEQKSLSALFGQLNEQFVSLMDVLQWMRSLEPDSMDAMDLMTAEALWHDTRSQYAQHVLQKYMQCPLSLPYPVDLVNKH